MPIRQIIAPARYITPRRKKRGRAAPRKMRGERQNLRQLAWRRRNAGICRSSSSRAGLARSVTSRLIEAWAGAGRARRLGRNGDDIFRRRTREPAARRPPRGCRQVVARLGRREGAGDALEQVRRAALGGRPRGNRSRDAVRLVRTGGLGAGRLTRQSFSSTSGRWAAAAEPAQALRRPEPAARQARAPAVERLAPRPAPPS